MTDAVLQYPASTIPTTTRRSSPLHQHATAGARRAGGTGRGTSRTSASLANTPRADLGSVGALRAGPSAPRRRVSLNARVAHGASAEPAFGIPGARRTPPSGADQARWEAGSAGRSVCLHSGAAPRTRRHQLRARPGPRGPTEAVRQRRTAGGRRRAAVPRRGASGRCHGTTTELGCPDICGTGWILLSCLPR
jgi:hypothetical protein